mmetsp:Transcript_121084/g.293779  ORF Transcript_121084/g.293779 Transcript_121084/m.293779 type:complete len:307 (-) Transcript_121084:630-1550(-)
MQVVHSPPALCVLGRRGEHHEAQRHQHDADGHLQRGQLLHPVVAHARHLVVEEVKHGGHDEHDHARRCGAREAEDFDNLRNGQRDDEADAHDAQVERRVAGHAELLVTEQQRVEAVPQLEGDDGEGEREGHPDAEQEDLDDLVRDEQIRALLGAVRQHQVVLGVLVEREVPKYARKIIHHEANRAAQRAHSRHALLIGVPQLLVDGEDVHVAHEGERHERDGSQDAVPRPEEHDLVQLDQARQTLHVESMHSVDHDDDDEPEDEGQCDDGRVLQRLHAAQHSEGEDDEDDDEDLPQLLMSEHARDL